jgi:hypothetical protein
MKPLSGKELQKIQTESNLELPSPSKPRTSLEEKEEVSFADNVQSSIPLRLEFGMVGAQKTMLYLKNHDLIG